MNICEDFRLKIIEYVEETLDPVEEKRLSEHVRTCPACQAELNRYVHLFELLDKDEVEMPDYTFFDAVKQRARQIELMPARRFTRWLKVLVPICAAVVIIVILLGRGEKSIEMSVPISTLLEDEEIAHIGLTSIINDKLVDELVAIEDYLLSEADLALEELTDEEEEYLLQILHDKYGDELDSRSDSCPIPASECVVAGCEGILYCCHLTGFTFMYGEVI
jgi:hypothetical protein